MKKIMYSILIYTVAIFSHALDHAQGFLPKQIDKDESMVASNGTSTCIGTSPKMNSNESKLTVRDQELVMKSLTRYEHPADQGHKLI